MNKLFLYLLMFLPFIPTACETRYSVKNFNADKLVSLDREKINSLCADCPFETVSQFMPSGYPVDGKRKDGFGWRKSPFGSGRDYHNGIDIAAPTGTHVKATMNGRVERAGWNGGYGYAVTIKNEWGLSAIYAHCHIVEVKTGDYVRNGDLIGWSGMTGNTTYAHCHYEIRVNDLPVDPDRIFKAASSGKYPCTPLHLAAELGDADLARRLIERGADRSYRDAMGFLPVQLAEISGRQAAAEILRPQKK